MFDDGTYEEIDSFKSQYQQINFLYNAETRDTCMDLDDTVQICGAYRPHYHEYAVHQTARFMPKEIIKQLKFVVGGAFMLPREYLEFDSLELVLYWNLIKYLFEHHERSLTSTKTVSNVGMGVQSCYIASFFID